MKRPLLLLGLTACATLGGEGSGDRGLPNAGLGPFRALTGDEVPGIAPFVLGGSGEPLAEPAALVLDEVGPRVRLYTTASRVLAPGAPSSQVLVAAEAFDGRSFAEPQVVLSADAPWEGDGLSGPSAVAHEGQVLLFYGGAEGIGIARATDGLHFVKEAAPCLTAAGAPSWEAAAPSAPSVVVSPEGRLRLFYAAGGSLGEADVDPSSLHCQRLDADPGTPEMDPVLGPGPGGPVGDPEAFLRTTASGRLLVGVLHTTQDPVLGSVVAVAARYGLEGPLTRGTSPAFTLPAGASSPAVAPFDQGTLLYAVSTRDGAPALAAAVAPESLVLGPPTP